MKRIVQFSIAVIAMVFILVGCQNKPEGDKAQSSESKDSGDSKDKLVLYTAGPDALVKDMVKDFEKESGKKVQVYQGTTGEILGRLEAEKDNPKADVVQLASLPAALDYKKQDKIEPYKVKNADKLYPDWQDKEGYWYGIGGSALGISYNTDKVKTAPKDVKDLLNKEYKDALAIPNPSESGTALDMLSIKVHNNDKQAWSDYQALKDNGMKLAGANKPALETVIKGENKAVYGGVDYMVYKAKKKGEPVDITFPESGTAISPSPAFILKSSQHKEAAKAYMDYATGEKGQKQVDAHFLIPNDKSAHKNKKTKAREDIKELKYDWSSLSGESEKVLKKFMSMMKG